MTSILDVCTLDAAAPEVSTADMLPPLGPGPKLERLGDEIAELSAYLDAAAARLLDLIREFDAQGGWTTGFRSCAEWLSWRTGLDLGAKAADVSAETSVPPAGKEIGAHR